MADFVAVLRKTIDGLADNTPALREKVYDKARTTVAAKLAAINPPPPAAVADRQKQVLEEAIRQVEGAYVTAEGNDPFAELEHVFAQPKKIEPVPAKPSQSWTARESSPPAMPRDVPASRPVPPSPGGDASDSRNTEAMSAADDDDPFVGSRPPVPFDGDDDEVADEPRFEEPVRRRSLVPLIAAVAALVLVLGAAYGVWLNRNDFMAMLGIGGGQTIASAPAASETAPVTPAPPATAAKPSASEPQPEETQKFTQRLKSD